MKNLYPCLCSLFLLYATSQLAAQNKNNFQHAYHQTLVMKLFLSIPDDQGGTHVSQNFTSALQIIKEVDQLTLEVPKIIYLVGWQYRGHDDQYPAFFEVNPALKRQEDTTATQSLRWLIREAKKYHTTVSLHINMTDAYEDSPLWTTYAEKDMLSKNADGSLLVIGNYNGKKAYQINYQREWENSYAQKRVDLLLELLPELKEAGTIHLDAWIARDSKGHRESLVNEASFQKQLADYWKTKGIDVTTEWVMDYMHGRVPYYWHFNGRTQDDYLKQSAAECTGSKMNPDLKNSDFGLEFLFGTSMYGENHFPDSRKKTDQSNWQQAFQQEFFLNFLQYDFLNRLKRLNVKGTGMNRVAFFSNEVQVSLNDSTVRRNELIYRSKNRVFFPVSWRSDNSYAVYSSAEQKINQIVPESWKSFSAVQVWQITKNGLEKGSVLPIRSGQLKLNIKAHTAILLTPLGDNIKIGGDTTIIRHNKVEKIANHPAYHQTLTMKLFLSQALFDGKFKRRDNGKTEVFLNAEQALEVIKKMDALSLGIPKIVYLVGWQYNGHDSGYPAWFEANKALKRPQDTSAMESLRWLMNEAKKYHTQVSLHINMFDAYEDSPLWDTYLKHNIIARRKDGSLLGGEWGYPISYAQEWATGFAQKRIDSLCSLLPIQQTGTVHIDAFHTWPPIPLSKDDGTWGVDLKKKPTSPYLSYTVADETAAQKNIYAYWASKGIDITSEGVDFLRGKPFESYQSMAWWFNQKEYYLKWPASIYTGGADKSSWGKLFGTSMHGEEIVKKDPVGLTGFKEQFSTSSAIWYFLNRLERKFLVEAGNIKEVHFSGNVITQLKGSDFSLEQAGIKLADNENILLPALWIPDPSLIAYSKEGYINRIWKLPANFTRYKKALLFEVGPGGLRKIGEEKIRQSSLKLSLNKDQQVLIKLY
ncbi:endo-alpha-N-acetylgalactosaminidase family protein [Flavihumibacter sp. UBA7668]|uniref:endo-alpha-N-acetylgalactosaminidase family protein n=1 Tax=Flavihumibacter sp. UBA7668 TaxID=1946542 RepID=UPI0025C605A5|nr:endo-alpha-N-acetylgalactosaminidase family protein [Flavihumibacter sp. UBA7668]